MVKRNAWLLRLETAWKKRSLIWLNGVRRAGKTSLCQSLENIEYFDCELPSHRFQMADPESFLKSMRQKRVVIDEIHRLQNPSELLKIAADYFPETQIVATGSSTLGASKKFKDTLTGRKTEIWLTPMTMQDSQDFGNANIAHRFLNGGLPPYFLATDFPEREIQEWMDAYWAKDIQELFQLQRKDSFQKLFELLLTNSGGVFEATKYAAPCEVSRETIMTYLRVLEATFAVHIVRPFNTHLASEIISAPKVFGLDTGFVCCQKRWRSLRSDDFGVLWEHIVLNELQARLQTRAIGYWRDKQGHEVDFVLPNHQGKRIAIECKWSYREGVLTNLKYFLKKYPDTVCYVVSHDTDRVFQTYIDEYPVTFLNLESLIERLMFGVSV